MKKVNSLLLIIMFFSVAQTATLYVNVKNTNGTLIQNAKVLLYDQNWGLLSTQYTNSSGKATFGSLNYGTYNYEVYYQGDAEEFWGSKENVQINSSSVTSDFTRFWPTHYSHSVSNPSPNVGDEVTIKVKVKNNSSFAINVKVVLWIDRDKVSSWDFNQTSVMSRL